MEKIVYRAQSITLDTSTNRQEKIFKPPTEKLHWCPPKSDFLNINFDGAFRHECKSEAWGSIVRGQEGSVVLAGAGKLEKIHDALCAEA
jgi:hypothetical protein